MFKPYAQLTPRERLIDAAAGRIRARRATDAHETLEAIVNECAACGPNTYGAQMRRYYRGISQNALERLIKAVERQAHLN